MTNEHTLLEHLAFIDMARADFNVTPEQEIEAQRLVNLANAAEEMAQALESSRNLLADLGHQDTRYFPTFQRICAALAKAGGAA